MTQKIKELIHKGVKIPNPESVDIGEDVNSDRISGNGVTIYSGCKIYGASTLILDRVRLGYEGPVTVENCQIGPDVSLKDGFFKQAVFLQKSGAGLGAHVREGTILEEQAGIAHTVGLKQTILFPFVTLGSLINFCDCLMAGGTDRKNHSEVGSSYIHFNFTPNQDKATPSLIGDVPKGVMLNQRPVFLGGQGGLVGPCRLNYGITIAAGSIWRQDELREDRLLFEGGKSGNIPFPPGGYTNVKRIVTNNIIYIANLVALAQWYKYVRPEFLSEAFPEPLLEGLKEKADMAFKERMKRLKEFFDKTESSSRWPEIEAALSRCPSYEGDTGLRDRFLEKITDQIRINGNDYISVIKGLDPNNAETGTLWLQGIVDHIISYSEY